MFKFQCQESDCCSKSHLMRYWRYAWGGKLENEFMEKPAHHVTLFDDDENAFQRLWDQEWREKWPDAPHWDKLPVWHPENTWRTVWQVFMAVPLLYMGTAFPYRLAFIDMRLPTEWPDPAPADMSVKGAWRVIDLVVDTLFWYCVWQGYSSCIVVMSRWLVIVLLRPNRSKISSLQQAGPLRSIFFCIWGPARPISQSSEGHRTYLSSRLVCDWFGGLSSDRVLAALFSDRWGVCEQIESHSANLPDFQTWEVIKVSASLKTLASLESRSYASSPLLHWTMAWEKSNGSNHQIYYRLTGIATAAY